MKKTKLVLLICLLFAIIFVTGCGASSDKSPSELLVGVWHYVELGYDASSESFTETITDATYTFTADFQYFYDGDGKNSGTYIVDGDKLTLITKKGNTFEQDILSIIELTPDKLVVRSEKGPESLLRKTQ